MTSADKLQHDYYTRTAATYDDLHVHEGDEHTRALRFISGFIQQLAITSVLDVGCGTGRGVKYLHQQHPQIRVHGVEPVPALVEQAIRTHNIPPDQISIGVGEYLRFGNASFDAAIEIGVLHHVPRPNAVVAEMTRVARKAIFLSDENRFGVGRLSARLSKLVVYKLGLWGAYFRWRTGGKGYALSEGDGVSYSYSVYDSYDLLARWADTIILIPLSRANPSSWCHPLLTTSHILLCALREPR